MHSDGSWCILCCDSGQVIVPHPSYVIMGEWNTAAGSTVKPTAAVTCTCRRGEAVIAWREGVKLKKQAMKLAEYESRIPRDLWRALLAEEWDRQKRESEELQRKRLAKLPPVASRQAPVSDLGSVPF